MAARPRWGYPPVTYVHDGIESAMAQAKATAGDVVQVIDTPAATPVRYRVRR